MNIESLCFRYYKIDPEIMFSNSPFLSENLDNISFTSPAFKMTVYT